MLVGAEQGSRVVLAGWANRLGRAKRSSLSTCSCRSFVWIIEPNVGARQLTFACRQDEGILPQRARNMEGPCTGNTHDLMGHDACQSAGGESCARAIDSWRRLTEVRIADGPPSPGLRHCGDGAPNVQRLGPLNPITPPPSLSRERQERWCHVRTQLDAARARRRRRPMNPKVIRRLLQRRLARIPLRLDSLGT